MPETKQKITDALKNNAVLITTTDTIPGLLANITIQGFEALTAIKQDRQNKPYIILISDITQLNHFVETERLNPKIQNLLNKCWPGPLTVIFKAKHDLPYFLKSSKGTIAIRCPNYKPLLEILKSFDGLFSTSANKSAHPSPNIIKNIDANIVAQVKYLVEDENQLTNTSEPSTIIDISDIDSDKTYLVRQGAYSTAMLETILGNKIQVKQG